MNYFDPDMIRESDNQHISPIDNIGMHIESTYTDTNETAFD